MSPLKLLPDISREMRGTTPQKEEGIVISRFFKNLKLNVVSFVKAENEEGMLPVNKLLHKESLCKLVMLEKLDGILPKK